MQGYRSPVERNIVVHKTAKAVIFKGCFAMKGGSPSPQNSLFTSGFSRKTSQAGVA